MRSRIFSALLILAATALVAAACGSATVDAGSADSADGPDSGGAPSDLDGEWLLADATIDGAALAPVDGYPITLEIDGDRIGGNAGCNGFGGSFTRDGSDVELIDVSITEMACADPAPMEAESAFIQGLWRVVSIERSGDGLILTGEDVSLTYSPVAPTTDASAIGTTWTLDSLLDGFTASSTINGADVATLVLDDAGTFTASTGCREIAGDYTLEDDRLVLQFETDDFACEGPAGEQDPSVLAVLQQQTALEVVETRLTLTAEDGTGLSYRTESGSS